MGDLREKLESELSEHQRESGLHVIGGRDRLIQRLLKAIGPFMAEGKRPENENPEQNGPCCR
jgi:hypothetical protein